jgi:hypothetical protein
VKHQPPATASELVRHVRARPYTLPSIRGLPVDFDGEVDTTGSEAGSPVKTRTRTTPLITRRNVLRGAGVALALPWLESLAPRLARGQAALPRVRFVPIYFPLGTAAYWKPPAPGAGAAWQLSPILEPLAPVKSHVTVLGHLDQTAYGPMGIEPSNGPLTASFLTCARCTTSRGQPGGNGQNGISIDQRYAQALAGSTPLPSLQLGLSTHDSFCDGTPCAYSRSISWKDPTTPLFKLVDPQAVFDTIVSGGGPVDPGAQARRAAQKSVLDFVIGNAAALSPRLGRSDRARMDQFLTSVRDLELQVANGASQAPCGSMARPTWSAAVGNVPADYSRDAHANVMMDLIVMALSCDATRVVSLMLDDGRSDFQYTFLKERLFTATGSTPGTIPCGNPVSYANSGQTNSGWATIDWWYVTKLSMLCQKLAAIPDGGGASLLDNSVIWFGSGQEEEWRTTDVPILYVGGAGGRLKVDRYIDFAPSQSLSNAYLTLLRFALGVPDATFGDSTGTIPDMVA